MEAQLVGSLLALASAVFYAAMYFLVRAGVRPTDFDGGAFVTTVVNVVMLVVTVGLVSLAGHPPAWQLEGVAWFAVAGLLSTFSGRVFMLAGLRRIGPVRTASIVNTAPIVTIAIAVLVLGETLAGGAVVAVGLVLLGLGLLTADAFSTPDPTLARGDRRTAPEASGTPGKDPTTPAVVGLILSSISAFSFGTGRIARRVGLGAMPDPLVGSMVGAIAALLTNVAMQAGQGRMRSVVLESFRDIRPALWLAGVASSLGLVCFFAALQFSPVSHVSVVAASETVITMLMSRVLFPQREALSGRVLVAAGCVFGAGILIALN